MSLNGNIIDPNLGVDTPGGGGGGGTAADITFASGGTPISAANVQVAITKTLDRTGVKGTWDMTGSSAGATPDAAHHLEATAATVSASEYTMTPLAGASQAKLVGSTVITKEAGARSARLRSATAGGNFLLSAMIFANSDATEADVLASVFGGLTGTATHVAVVILDNAGMIGPGANKIAVTVKDPVIASQTDVISGNGAYTDLDEIYITFNGTAGTFKANINAGPDLAGTDVWDLTTCASLRAYVMTYFSSTTPSLPDGTFNFDFSDNSGGRTGFNTVADPVPPVTALDGVRYEVSVGGSYGGRSAVAGDIVEFHSNLTKINVLKAEPYDTAQANADIAAYLTANPQVSLLTEAKIKQLMVGALNNWDEMTHSDKRDRAVCCIVGPSPTGDFAAFPAGSVAVYSGAKLPADYSAANWVNYSAEEFEGIIFSPVWQSGSEITGNIIYRTQEPTWVNDSGNVYGIAYSDLNALNWYFVPAHGTSAYPQEVVLVPDPAPGGGNTVRYDDCGFKSIRANTVGAYTIYPATAASGKVRTVWYVANMSGGAITITFMGGQFPGVVNFKADDRMVIVIEPNGLVTYAEFEKDFSGSRQWTAPTLLNSWTNIGGTAQLAQYRRIGEYVDVRLAIQNGTAATLFTLPVGFRPSYDIGFSVNVHDNTDAPDFGHIKVMQNGDVILEHPGPLSSHKVWATFQFSAT